MGMKVGMGVSLSLVKGSKVVNRVVDVMVIIVVWWCLWGLVGWFSRKVGFCGEVVLDGVLFVLGRWFLVMLIFVVWFSIWVDC